VSGHAGQAPGVVKVRLMGADTDVGRLARFIGKLADGLDPAGCAAVLGDFQVIEQSPPRQNRRAPGGRVYLTLQFTRSPGQVRPS
jgi:hypothetical protein